MEIGEGRSVEDTVEDTTEATSSKVSINHCSIVGPEILGEHWRECSN